jgi:hypothetical protein
VQKRQSQKKPQFLSELGPITITEGETLTAKVIISGDPTPYTKWSVGNSGAKSITKPFSFQVHQQPDGLPGFNYLFKYI